MPWPRRRTRPRASPPRFARSVTLVFVGVSGQHEHEREARAIHARRASVHYRESRTPRPLVIEPVPPSVNRNHGRVPALLVEDDLHVLRMLRMRRSASANSTSTVRSSGSTARPNMSLRSGVSSRAGSSCLGGGGGAGFASRGARRCRIWEPRSPSSAAREPLP
jgi:hypothetical protein